jgi:23S rRNA (cytosine1962-C5)-methyltransferase
LINEIINNLTIFPKQAARVFHGRGQNFSGYEKLNIEWYPPFIFVQNFGETLDQTIEKELIALFDSQQQIECILIQNRTRPELSSYILCERVSEVKSTEESLTSSLPVTFWTNLSTNLRCQVTLGKNQNTGVFLDMRAGWEWVKQHASDKNVLNLFSYTGVFSLFALEGGANKVTNMDMAANVLKTAQRNHQKNNLSSGKSAFYKRDILKSAQQYSKMGPYDLIIIDPPPFQKKSFRGWQDYEKLLHRCRTCLSEKGCLFVCLNNPQVTSQDFMAKLQAMFPDAAKIENIATADEIKEANTDKGLKTVVVYF